MNYKISSETLLSSFQSLKSISNKKLATLKICGFEFKQSEKVNVL